MTINALRKAALIEGATPVSKYQITQVKWIIGLFAAFILLASFIFERFMLKNTNSVTND